MAGSLTSNARKLRKHSTDAERLFWSRVRAQRLQGWKFKRQQPMERYVVDFVCFEAKLIVELDGGQHALAKDQHSVRDEWLVAQGFRVLRFWNNEVLGNIDGVMQRVMENLVIQPLVGPLSASPPLPLSPSPQPSPTRGEGVGVGRRSRKAE